MKCGEERRLPADACDPPQAERSAGAAPTRQPPYAAGSRGGGPSQPSRPPLQQLDANSLVGPRAPGTQRVRSAAAPGPSAAYKVPVPAATLAQLPPSKPVMRGSGLSLALGMQDKELLETKLPEARWQLGLSNICSYPARH